MKDLETKNLRIRKFKIEDAKDVYENLATEKKLADSLDYNVHRNIEETKRVIFSYIKEYETGGQFNEKKEKIFSDRPYTDLKHCFVFDPGAWRAPAGKRGAGIRHTKCGS